jgi:hypothetical protein
VCLDITRDVMKMHRAKAPLAQIRRDIDAKYRQFGPPTPTPLPK